MAYLVPDITGSNALYRVDNFIRVISRTDQKFVFDTSVVFSGRNYDTMDSANPTKDLTLSLYLIGTINIPLIYGQDWIISPDDIDYTEASSIKVQYPHFNFELIKSITIIRNIAQDVKINCSHSRLYPLQYRSAFYRSQPLEVTPTLIAELIEQVDYLTRLTQPVSNTYTLTEFAKPLMLEPDPHKQNPDNVILEEKHIINVPDNKYVVHPVAGAFFKDSVTVKFDNEINAPVILEEGPNKDYLIFGLEVKKTQLTSNKSGVYRFILIRKSLVGNVYINYHAYGGDPTVHDIHTNYELINSIITHINQAKFLTPDAVASVPVIEQLIIRLNDLEVDMRRLLQAGKPSYGDATRGTLLKRIKANDTQLHWYTIAQLYKVDGSPEVVIADEFHFRFQSVTSKFMFNAIIGVDISNPNNKLDINILSENYPLGYIPFENYDNLDFVIRPQLRIIWNENISQQSGINLQLGWQLKNAAEETIAVEDLSGQQSCWKLVPEVDYAVGPEDILVQLPNADHQWESINPDSQQVTSLIPFKRGYLVWAGTESLNRLPDGGGSGAWDHVLIDHFIEDNSNLERLDKVRLDLIEESAEGATLNEYPIFVHFIHERSVKKGYASIEYNGKPAHFIVTIKPNTSEPTKRDLIVRADIEAGLQGNELTLHHVILYAY
jgi:hypothetical protein